MLSISQRLLFEQSVTDDAVATPIAFKNTGCEDQTHYIEWNDGVSSGEVTVEVAAEPDYAGKWIPLAVFTFDGSIDPAPKIEYVRTQGQYGAFRHRITQEITDGTVTSKIVGTEAS